VPPRHVPAELLPDFDYVDKLARPGLRERVLREASISALHTEMFFWRMPIPSAAAVWSVISTPAPFARAQDSLAGSERSHAGATDPSSHWAAVVAVLLRPLVRRVVT
jgi:hypothetical protein